MVFPSVSVSVVVELELKLELEPELELEVSTSELHAAHETQSRIVIKAINIFLIFLISINQWFPPGKPP